MTPLKLQNWFFGRQLDSQAVGAFRIAYAAAGLFYVFGAIQLVDVAWPARQALFTTLYAIWMVVLALLLLGFHARTMAIGSFALTLVCNSNPLAGAVGELMWRAGGFWLLFMESGASLSVMNCAPAGAARHHQRPNPGGPQTWPGCPSE